MVNEHMRARVRATQYMFMFVCLFCIGGGGGGGGIYQRHNDLILLFLVRFIYSKIYYFMHYEYSILVVSHSYICTCTHRYTHFIAMPHSILCVINNNAHAVVCLFVRPVPCSFVILSRHREKRRCALCTTERTHNHKQQHDEDESPSTMAVH